MNGYRQPSRKIVQNNNNEVDQGSPRKNGEDKEMFMKDLEELKNKQTEMNDILEGINSRITEKNGYLT